MSYGRRTVVGPQFTAARPMELVMTKKFRFSNDSFVVTDVNGNALLKFKQKGTFSTTILLVDNAGNTVVSLRPKQLSLSGIWRIYRGDSSEPRDLLFTVKDPPFLESNNCLNVFLGHNTDLKVPDFIIKPNRTGSSCTIHFGDSDSSPPIAQMHENNSFKDTITKKETLAVSVNPNVDYAFIATLVVVNLEKAIPKVRRGGPGPSDGLQAIMNFNF